MLAQIRSDTHSSGNAGELAVPPVAYRLNCFGPPHISVPVDTAPIEPLQTSVHACAPVRLLIADDP
jgi:hypothetical protein